MDLRTQRSEQRFAGQRQAGPARGETLMSWLKAFGQKVKTIFDDTVAIEKQVEPIVEEVLPQSIPIFDVFDTAVEIGKSVEGSSAAAAAQANGPAKLAAALPGLSAALDAYTTAKFPGTTTILKEA